MYEKMIMTRAPLRITFVGGGTDIPFYYRVHEPGAVVSASINKYIYVTVNQKFDDQIRISYSKTEIVDTVDEIKHPSVREALRLLDLNKKIEIVSISDIPSTGTGLGSSSTFVVALLHALHSYKGEHVSSEQLAKEAVKIEREILKEPGGKQDQYMAAFGKIQFMKFYSDESVDMEPVITHNDNVKKLEQSLLLLYTGKCRSSTVIHKNQEQSATDKIAMYDQMRDLTTDLCKAIGSGNVFKAGEIMHQNWILKRQLADGISDEWIDEKYKKARELGALGGKIVGAGGGGFLLLVAEPEKHEKIVAELKDLRPIPFKFDFTGSRVIFVGDQ